MCAGSAPCQFCLLLPSPSPASADANIKRIFSDGASFTRHRSADVRPDRTGSDDDGKQSSFGKHTLAISDDTKPHSGSSDDTHGFFKLII
jgi:hypothetical protein